MTSTVATQASPGEAKAFELTVRVARNVEVVRRTRSSAVPAGLGWWLAVAIAGGHQVHVDDARFDRGAGILAGSSNRAVAALAAFPFPKARVDQIDDDTVENGSRDCRLIGERDAAHVGVKQAATDNA